MTFVPNNVWSLTYEGLPPDTENASLGASRIRDLKLDVRQRLIVDHQWEDPSATANNDGKHNKVTLRTSAADPLLDPSDAVLYQKTVGGNSELFWEDSSGNIVQLTSLGKLSTSAFALGTLTLAINTTLSNTQVNLTCYNSASGVVATLPIAANVAAGALLLFQNNSGTFTVSRNGGDANGILLPNNSTAASFVLSRIGDFAILVNAGAAWRVVSASWDFPLLDAANIFTGNNTLNGTTTFGGASLGTFDITGGIAKVAAAAAANNPVALSQFNLTFGGGNSGYFTIPGVGAGSILYVQWGNASVTVANGPAIGTSVAVTFPIAFPNAFFSGYATCNSNGAVLASVLSPSRTGMAVTVGNFTSGANGGTYTVYWLATGN